MPPTLRPADSSLERTAGRSRGKCNMANINTLAHRYVAQRHARGEIEARTAEQLRSRLRSFAHWTKVPPDRVNRRHVERWMELPGLSPAYRRGRLSALRGFCQWCVLNKHMKSDPTLGIKMPSVPEGLPRARSLADVTAILGHCTDLRAKVAVLLMVQEGLRRAEVAYAQVADLCFRSNALGVRGKGGKGVVTRTVPISAETVTVLRRYLSEVGMTAGPVVRSLVHPDRGISPGHVGKLVTDAMWAAGVKIANGDGCSPHALRHSTAHDMIGHGADVLDVQQMLGHRSINNTMVYLRGHVSPDLRAAASGRTYLTGRA